LVHLRENESKNFQSPECRTLKIFQGELKWVIADWGWSRFLQGTSS
jgi:hypothetical protein